MDKRQPHVLVSVFRGLGLALHLVYGMSLAIFYPHLDQKRQRRVVKNWSRQLLSILNIGIQIEGSQPARGEGGCLLVANHVSWLDVFVLNAIHPSRFIAKSEVRGWPLVGWLCKRGGNIFIDRNSRQDASIIKQQVGHLLGQGACVGLFPEGTTTDGRQVGHFHSALIQPAIDAGVKICPIALRYQNYDGQNDDGQPSTAAPFIGDMTLAESIWKILRCQHQDALLVFAPALIATDGNRRVLARAAQEAIAQGLKKVGAPRQVVFRQATSTIPQDMLSSKSAYALLLDPVLNQVSK